MNAHARNFDVKEAVRESVPLLVGLMGPSGGGKTYSALRLAKGIQAVTGGDIYGIDTEARRMLHYADTFRFKHVQFDAPFASLDYLAAIRQCVAAGAKIVIVDSMSHEHTGPGGMLDYQERELDRLAGDDYGKRERMKMLAWQKPKAARRTMIDGILQLNCNFVFCFRAKETAKPVKMPNGKTEIINQGFMPIAGEEMVFEMTLNCLLLPHADGVPTWTSENVGERMMMKLPEQFRSLFAESRPLDESTGRQLAEWARGGAGAQSADPLPAARAAAANGKDALQAHWKTLNQADKKAVNAIMDELKAAAMKADAEPVADPFAQQAPQSADPAPAADGSAEAPEPTSEAATRKDGAAGDDDVMTLEAARRRGAEAARAGAARKALPGEYRGTEFGLEWQNAYDREREKAKAEAGADG
jgi:ABC-type dipeptide/oligopeptide/nickel transport system ATPase subunit